MPKITDPICIGTMEVKNRIVAAPTVVNCADADGYVTDRLISIYEERARGGAGLVHVEATFIRPDGCMFSGNLGIYSPKHVTGLNELADVIHLSGARACIQLLFGGRQAPAHIKGSPPLSASNRAPWGGVTPEVLTTKQCEELIESFVAAAMRAKEAGFDAVMLHSAHGFIFQEFMSPYINDRKDKYGEPLAFVTETIQGIKGTVGKAFPVLIRISGDEYLGDKGITISMTTEKIAPALERAGVDCIDVSAGIFETAHYIVQPIYFPRGAILPLAEAVKKVVKVPVVGVGRINDPKLAERVVEEGRVDMVAMCRALLSDPDFPRKTFRKEYDEVRKCIACDACIDRTFMQYTVKCSVNPSFGMKEDYALQRAPKPKKVMVVGGGIGGMEAARVASMKGHEVCLFEKTAKLGGLLNIASSFPKLYTRELANIVDWLTHQLKSLPIKVELNKEVTPQDVKQFGPDAVILATGSSPLMPAIEGICRSGLFSLDDYLLGRAKVGDKVAVLGAPHGAEVAVSLRREGKEVFLIEESTEDMVGCAPYIGFLRRLVLQSYVRDEGVWLFCQCKIKEITSEGLRLVDKDGKERFLKVDNIIVALGRQPNNELANAIRGKVPQLFEVGDCLMPRRVFAAIHEASNAAGQI